MYRPRAVVLFSSDHARKVTVKIMQIRIVNEEGLCPSFSLDLSRALQNLHVGEERDCSQSNHVLKVDQSFESVGA